MHFNLNNYLNKLSDTLKTIVKEEEKIIKISEEIIKCNRKGNKILLVGNGGSCSDVEHFGGELICTFSKKKKKTCFNTTTYRAIFFINSMGK